MNKIEKQILTNQLCILATLKTIGRRKLHPVQLENIEKRIEETFEVRDGKGSRNK